MKKIIFTMIICLILDRIIKIICINNLAFGDSLNIINNFFAITLVSNTGAAFSILSSNTLLLIILSIIIIFVIYFFFIRNKNLSIFMQLIYGVLLGGIFGNLIDRIVYNYVIDYLDFNILGYNFPVFNFADICIVISIILIIIDTIKGEKHEISSR